MEATNAKMAMAIKWGSTDLKMFFTIQINYSHKPTTKKPF